MLTSKSIKSFDFLDSIGGIYKTDICLSETEAHIIEEHIRLNGLVKYFEAIHVNSNNNKISLSYNFAYDQEEIQKVILKMIEKLKC